MVTDPGQGAQQLLSGATAAEQLSGFTRLGGDTYWAVGDNGAKSFWNLSISVDPSTGWITSSGVTGGTSASGLGTDSEGIAYAPSLGTLYVSDEVGSSILSYDLSGSTTGSVALPSIFQASNVANNMGLESLAYGAGNLWTANEETLLPDGAQSTTSSGSWIRIQRFDSLLSPSGQWAYQTDAITGMSPWVSTERSGVVDLLPWSDTELLVLEREFGGALIPDFRSRLYLVDLSAASDVSSMASLASGGYSPATKSLLWEGNFSDSNFEGMAFGPELDDGSTSLLLISDNGNSLAQNLYALTIVPEPSIFLLSLPGALLLIRRQRAPR